MQTDLFGVYVRHRLDEWGDVFAYHRDVEWLGHKSKDMLQVLIEHKGEMPPRPTGFKPLEVSPTACQIEDIVREVFCEAETQAMALRAYYCGRGRRGYERFETFKQLIGRGVSKRSYFESVRAGEDGVRERLLAQSRSR